MNRLLEVCLVALTIMTGITPSVAAHSPPLQKGVSVQMPVTRDAVSWPDADKTDALVVAVTEDGRVYLGIAPVTPSALAERLKAGLSHKPEKNLYVKADARTPYANVARVLDALRKAGVESFVLLTSQRGATKPGTRVLPQGLEILLAPPTHDVSNAAVVDLARSGQQEPTLTVNNEQIARAGLPTTLRKRLQNGRGKVVLVKADGSLPFSEVVGVSDISRSVGAEVVLAMPGL